MSPNPFIVVLSGQPAEAIRYDKTKPRTMRISLRNALHPSKAEVGYKRKFKCRVKGVI